MKFLVLALCVCAASAATTFSGQPWQVRSSAKAVVGQNAFPQQTYPQPARNFNYKPIVKNIEVQPVVSANAEAVVNKPEIAAPVGVFKPIDTPVKTVAAKSYVSTNTVNNESDAPIIRSENEVSPVGFNYIYETGNGIAAQAVGTLKKVDDTEVVSVEGSYQYTAPDGTPVQFTYTADENGYQPRSDLLPVAPPVPEAILRSLEWIATRTANEARRN